MTRFALRSVAVAGAVLLAVAMAVVWLIATESGLHAAWRVAAPFLPTELSVGRLDGRLVGPVVLRDVRYDRPDLHVAIERVELEWWPAALSTGRLDIERLLARGIDVTRTPLEDAPPATDTTPWQPPERISLPVGVSAHRIELADLRLRPAPDAEPVVLETIRFTLSFSEGTLTIPDLEVSGPLVDMRGQTVLNAYDRYETDMDLAFWLRPNDRPEVSGALAASGGLDRLELGLRVEPPYAIGADLVVVDVLERLMVEGDLRAQFEPALIGMEAPVSAASAELHVAGGLEDLALTGHVDVAVPDLTDARVDLAGRWQSNAFELDTLDISDRNSSAAISLAGRVALEPALFLNLGGEWRDLAWPLQGDPLVESARGELTLTGTLDELTAQLFAELGPGGEIEGQVARSAERFDAELTWRELIWPQRDPRLASANGRLDARGTFDAYRFILDADLAALDQPVGAAGHLFAEGAGTASGVELERLEAAVLDGVLAGGARVAWAPALEGEVDLELTQLDPSVLLPEWPGRLDGRLRASAAMTDDRITAEVEHVELVGALRGRNVEVDARGAYRDPNQADIERLQVSSGQSRLSIEGEIGSTIDLAWDINSANLDDFWPGFQGRLESSGSAEGPFNRPIVTASAEGEGVAFDGVAVERLQLDARIDTAGNAESDVRLELADARVADREIERLQLQGSGTASAHRVSAAVAAEGADAELALSGVLARPWEPDFEWRFELEENRVGYGELAEWVLESRAVGALSASGAELSAACWRSGEATLCVDASRRAADTLVQLALERLPLRYFAPYLPDDVVVAGSVSASGGLALSPEELPRAELSLETSSARIASRGRTAVPGLRFEPGRVDLAFDGARLDVDVALPLERGEGGVEATGRVMLAEGEPLTAGNVEAHLRASIHDLRFVSDLVAGVDETTGMVSMDIDLSGTVASPQLAGHIALDDGSARLRAPGITLEDVRIQVEGDGSGDVLISAAVGSGGGTLMADGRLSIESTQPVGRLTLRGEEFELANIPDARVWVSPDLSFDLARERLSLTGRVVMPRARFTPREIVEGAVTVSDDQVIVDAEVPRRARFDRPFYARVELVLGDEVRFDGFGLTGQLGGALEIIEAPQEPVIGSGELRVQSGTYEAYGQELEVRTGRLLFAGGALSRPGLDIEAVRRPTEEILVGARVRGTLDRPELSVFSEPGMPRQEQLSYLLLGRPLESTSTSETSALSQAALALGLRGGNFVSERLNEALGFDTFGIQSEPTEATSASFVIGKYLTPSLYVSYGVGLFEPVNTLRLRYTISSRWRLVTESSTVASGGDLIYNIERGN